jgi:hypothetical protein
VLKQERRQARGRGSGAGRAKLEQAAVFHGHLGPWLALGLRAGTHARRTFKVSPFELTAKVHCPERPPYSCFIDGVQFGSGCTMGKGNICHIVAPGCRVEFRAPARARARLVLELLPAVWDELHAQPKPSWQNGAALGRVLYRRPLARLFRVR